MKITAPKKDITQLNTQAAIIFFDWENGLSLEGCEKTDSLLRAMIDRKEIKAEKIQLMYLPIAEGFSCERIMAIGLSFASVSPKGLRQALGKAIKQLNAGGVTEIAMDLSGFGTAAARSAVEGLLLGAYRFSSFKTETPPKPLKKLQVILGEGVSLGEVQRWATICEGTCLARDLMLTPPNVLHPKALAKKAEDMAEAAHLEVTVLKPADLKKENMNALMAVAQGSDQEPRFIVMDYHPEGASRTIAFVGKAVTFDSGGLSLKPADAMPEMKGDMGGGAVVFGLMSVLQAVGCPYRVVGIVPAVENMPSGKATRPSDVVTTRAGITVEINNTDAEGRLILADALDYAKQFKPDYVVDFATLTGACMIALGPKVCGVMGNDQPLVDAIVSASYELDEPFWQLPLEEDYEELLKSETADISNVASVRWGGAITAGLFLQRFAKDFRWAHCDIAASILERPQAIHPKGGSGTGVRTLIDVLDRLPD
jgi:leucyl aminopeptidase